MAATHPKYVSKHGSAQLLQGTGSKSIETAPGAPAAAQTNSRPLTYGNAPKIQKNQITACPDVLDADCWAEVGEWALVDSSNVAAIAYNKAAQELYVEFLGKGKMNSVYVYRGVPEGVAKDMFNASSQGRFVWQRLRDVYAHSKIRG